jgi:hypothetical protein
VIPKLGLLDQETIEKASPGKDLKPAAV